MKNTHYLLLTSFFILFGTNVSIGQQLYTEGPGNNPTWDDLIKNKILPMDERSYDGVTGTDINVKNNLVEVGPNKNYPIIEDDLYIHTLGNTRIPRKDFAKWSRWYQEDGKTQVFRLFPHEENAVGDRDKSGGNTFPRIESFIPLKYAGFSYGDGWNEFAATYTIIKPHDAMIFQSKNIEHDWSVGLNMDVQGNVRLNRRRGTDEIVLTNMVGKPFHVFVRDDGLNYEVYINGGFVGGGFWERPTNNTTFRWGMYCGKMYKKEALMFVHGAVVNPKNYDYKKGGNHKHSCVSPKIALAKKTSEKCGQKGSLTFNFPDHYTRTHLEFSVDNGKTFPYSVEDAKKSFTINGLSAGYYKLWVRWGDDSCPVGFGDTTIEKEGSCNPNPPSGNCNFDTPRISGIPAMDKITFSKAYVIGTGGPSLSNFKKFSINWNPTYNGLYQFAINTKNGTPNWYVDFTDDMSYQLKNSKPEVTLRKTGFANLDGNYWVNRTSNSLILKSKNKNYSIHFTNSSSKPSCSNKNLDDLGKKEIQITENPFSEVLGISGLGQMLHVVELYNIQGTKVLSRSVEKDISEVILPTDHLTKGVYFVNIRSTNGSITFSRKIIKQ